MKLKWKKKWLDDKSGYWYSAKVPILNWEYVVEGSPNCTFSYKKQECDDYDKFVIGLFLSNATDDLTKISKKQFRKKETAMECCEKHLHAESYKFIKWIKTIY